LTKMNENWKRNYKLEGVSEPGTEQWIFSTPAIIMQVYKRKGENWHWKISGIKNKISLNTFEHIEKAMEVCEHVAGKILTDSIDLIETRA